MWELFTYGGGDFLRLVFNAIASIFGNDDYQIAIATAALCGLLSIMIMVAFRKGDLNIHWLIGIIMVYQIALVPKVDIIIVDEIVPANSSVVSNIPMGLALTATIFSRFSHWSTSTMETVFSLPNNIRYQGNGLLFANSLVESAGAFEFTDPRIATNFSEFWKSCVYYDLLLGLYNWDDVIKEDNLMVFFQGNTSITRSFTYRNSLGTRSIVTCAIGINNDLAVDYANEIASATNIHGARLATQEVDYAAAVIKYSASMPVAYQYMTGISYTNAQIVGQNAIANSLKRGLVNFASEADAPAAAQDFALARAEQQRSTSFLTMGYIAKKMLPMLQQLFESFIYVAFFFVMLMAVTPLVGKVTLGYIKALFWINLWPPLYAVLHFAVTYYSQGAASAAVITNGAGFTTGMTIMTNTGLSEVMKDYSAVAGYLAISIPMIAWMFVSMSGAVLSGVAGRIMQGYEQPVSSAASETASGVSLGNTSYMNTSAFQHNSSPTVDSGTMHERLGSGTMMTIAALGRFLDQNVSHGATSVDIGQSIVSTAQQRLDNATQHMSQESSQLSESNMAVLRDSESFVDSAGLSQGAQTRKSELEANVSQIQHSEIDNAISKYAESNGITVTDELRGSIYGAIEASTGISIFGNGATVGGGANVQGSTSESEATNYQHVKDFTSSSQFSNAVQNIASGSREMSASFGINTDQTASSALDATLAEQRSNSHDFSESVSQVDSATSTLSRAESFTSSFKQDGLDQLKTYATQSGNLSESQFDQLLIQANRGGSSGNEALEQLRTMAIDGVMSGGLELDFNGAKDGIMDLGTSSVQNKFASNNDSISGVSDVWQSSVATNAGITKESANDAINRSSSSIDETINNPASLRTPSHTVENINRKHDDVLSEGSQTSNRVDDMRVLSDGAPGVASIVGDAIRDKDIDSLSSDTFDRIANKLNKKGDS